jgi:hypothetical protein
LLVKPLHLVAAVVDAAGLRQLEQVELADNRRIASSLDLLEEQVSRATRLAYPLRPKPFASEVLAALQQLDEVLRAF